VQRRLRPPFTELLDVVRRHDLVAREVEGRVLKPAAVARGEHEAVAVDPIRVGRIEVHFICKEAEATRSLTHGSARVAAVGLDDGDDGKEADGVDAVGRGLGAHRCGPRGNGRAALAVPRRSQNGYGIY